MDYRARMTGIEGLYAGKVFDLKKDVIFIGREQSCDIHMDDKKSSRKHARMEWIDNNYWIEDLKSTNGIMVNDTSVIKTKLRHDDRIIIGGTVFVYKINPAYEKPSGKVFVDEDMALQEEHTIFIDPEKIYNIDFATKEKSDKTATEMDYKRYSIMLKVANALASSFDFSGLLEKIMDEIFNIFPVDRGVIMLFDETGTELEPKVSKHREKSNKSDIFVSKTIIDKVINRRQSICTSDVKGESFVADSESIILSDIRSIMCVPVIFKDDIMGLIQVDTKISKHCFSKEDLELLTAVSYQAAIAMENTRLYKKLQNEAAIRANLSRYLPANLVEDVISGKKGLGLGGEVRDVTVLFSDIRGFTKMSEKMKPYEVVKFLNEYLTAMSEIIFDYNGMIDKFIGDAIMAIFGGPWTDGDGPSDSVKTAIDMLEAMRELNNKWSAEGRPVFNIGIGINSGNVVLGNIGSSERMEYTAIGDTVNTASRLVSVAKAGQIIVSEEVYKRVKDSFAFRPLPPAEVKGKEKPLVIYEVIS